MECLTKDSLLKFMQWFVAFRKPIDIWSNHSSYLIIEIVTYFFAVLTFRHAYRLGGRYMFLWFAIIAHGLTVESVSYFVPDIDNFWHAQSMIMLLGKRLPLHIIFFYPVFLYTAGVAAARLKLPFWAEPFAHGLAVVAMDVPFDIMGIKSLWWTWHDTDPNIYDRHYWVPWTSYFFHMSFASSLNILINGSRKLLTGSSSKIESKGCFKEMMCVIITGLFSFPLGALQFVLLYHPLHDNLHIHTEVCVFILVAIYICIVWNADRNPDDGARPKKGKKWLDEIGLLVSLHFMLYILLTVNSKPENIRSIGLHEPTGNCNATTPVYTAMGQVLSKKTYLCTTEYDEAYYDWHCLTGGKPPKDGMEWYTICGNAFPNHTEYIVVVTAFSLIGLFYYWQMCARSGKDQTRGKKMKKS
ncbi:uncharacterized protein LOC100378455 [Saccoglossus kowalevskii]|uniref:Uncharacterized protein LOC100378455 n=1 Tax=Saccoglossus kowalevskii TaxID=10224 RepID=A0ABM0LW31_SACKO|nr:PREDICTED: uncharacterized protein LOC100378455 [Saccoglossus kowalevskii]